MFVSRWGNCKMPAFPGPACLRMPCTGGWDFYLQIATAGRGEKERKREKRGPLGFREAERRPGVQMSTAYGCVGVWVWGGGVHT